MEKRVGKVLFFTVLSIVLLVSSCQPKGPGGETPLDTVAALREAQSGTQGVEVRTVPNFPPPTIYDQTELIAILEVRNKGSYDLEPQNCFIQATGFDPNIILGGFGNPRSCADGIAGTLEGKKVYNLEGGLNQIEIKATSISLPTGVFEYNPTLNFVTCYSYHTTASPSVCVDPKLITGIASEQITCRPHNVGLGGGQGGPVGASYVGVEMAGSKAFFEINVVNYGSGKVVSPFATPQNCGEASLNYRDLDKVAYSVQMSGGSLIDCKPRDGFVRLSNNQGKIQCSFNIPGSTSYETPLLIDLDYGYIESYTKPLRIIKTPE